MANALNFPDTTELLGEYQLEKRQDNLPVLFSHPKRGEVELQWAGDSIASVIIRRRDEFNDVEFQQLAKRYGRGAAWHELPLTGPGTDTLRALWPGLEQQWILMGYGGESGWLGAGLRDDLFFLVFANRPAVAQTHVVAPLTADSTWFARLDTTASWIQTPCDPTIGTGRCFRNLDDTRMWIRRERRGRGASVWILTRNPLEGIRDAMDALDPGLYAEYAEDLAGSAGNEAQTALIRIAGAAPGLLNWPSWQLQSLDEGVPGKDDYRRLFREWGNRWPHWPVLEYKGPGGTIAIRVRFEGATEVIFGFQP